MDIEKFFDNYILKYPVYQNNRVYQILIDKFKSVFLKDTYEDIPSIFKKLYENNEIPSDVYDHLLIDIGLSKDLIDQLSTSDKLIFIKSLADFQKYKSTVGLVESVIRAYGNNVEVYELYVDYNKDYNRWDCKPYPIYKPDYTDGYNKTIPYSVVYEKVPNLLIHERQLTRMRDLKLAVFPIKTNIVFVTSNYNQSITSCLQNLIISVFRKTYKDNEINLHFEDQLITCTLHQFILIWLYLIFTSKDDTCDIDSKLTGLYVDFNSENIDITIDELDAILTQYENIGMTSTSRSCGQNETLISDIDSFYNQYIHPLKSSFTESTTILNKSKIEEILKSSNSALINYINTRLLDTDTSLLINILIQSLESYKKTVSDSNFTRYFQYFKSFLPTIDLVPSQNTVYKILYHLKPFHTDFLDLQDLSMIVSNDKFNSFYFNHFYRSNLYFKYCDIEEVDSIYKSNMLRRATEDVYVASILSRHSFLLKVYEDEDDIYDDLVLLFNPDDLLDYSTLSGLYGW